MITSQLINQKQVGMPTNNNNDTKHLATSGKWQEH